MGTNAVGRREWPAGGLGCCLIETEGDTGQPVGAGVDPSGTPMGGGCLASAHERLRVVSGRLVVRPCWGTEVAVGVVGGFSHPLLTVALFFIRMHAASVWRV